GHESACPSGALRSCTAADPRRSRAGVRVCLQHRGPALRPSLEYRPCRSSRLLRLPILSSFRQLERGSRWRAACSATRTESGSAPVIQSADVADAHVPSDSAVTSHRPREDLAARVDGFRHLTTLWRATHELIETETSQLSVRGRVALAEHRRAQGSTRHDEND